MLGDYVSKVTFQWTFNVVMTSKFIFVLKNLTYGSAFICTMFEHVITMQILRFWQWCC